jgi:DNA-binding transcriptional ArsR family regulator
LLDQEKLSEQKLQEQAEVYNLTTVEQVRVMADELRQRILEELRDEPRTVTQVGEILELAPSKVHYHVRELERVGLVNLVATREKGGILEKYYRSVARSFWVPRELFQHAPREDFLSAIKDILDECVEGVTSALLRLSRREELGPERHLVLGREHLWMTEQDFDDFRAGLNALVEKYQAPKQEKSGRLWTFVPLAYDTALSLEGRAGGEGANTVAAPASIKSVAGPLPVSPPWPGESVEAALRLSGKSRSWVMGVVSLNRKDLERAVNEGKTMDLRVVGFAHFSDDIPAELAEKAIARFWHRGKVRASPEVLEVLERKEAKSSEVAP